MPRLILVLVSVAAGTIGAYVTSRDPFHALTAGGTLGFAAAFRVRRSRLDRALPASNDRGVGWALVAAAAVLVAGWLSLGLLAYFVRGNSTVVKIDTSVARWGDRNASAFSDGAVGLVTMLGNTRVVVDLALALVFVDWLRRRNGRVVLFVVLASVARRPAAKRDKRLINRELSFLDYHA